MYLVIEFSAKIFTKFSLNYLWIFGGLEFLFEFFPFFYIIFQIARQFSRPLGFNRLNLSRSAPRQLCQAYFKWEVYPHFTSQLPSFTLYRLPLLLRSLFLLPSQSHLQTLSPPQFPSKFKNPKSPNPNPVFSLILQFQLTALPPWLPKLAPSVKERNQSAWTPHLGMITPSIPLKRLSISILLELSPMVG